MINSMSVDSFRQKFVEHIKVSSLLDIVSKATNEEVLEKALRALASLAAAGEQHLWPFL